MLRARGMLALHAEMADLVRLGAYRTGTDPAVDEAIRLAPRIEAMLAQAQGRGGTRWRPPSPPWPRRWRALADGA